MHKEIIAEVKNFSDNEYAKWASPLLRMDENPNDILIGVRIPILRKLA